MDIIMSVDYKYFVIGLIIIYILIYLHWLSKYEKYTINGIKYKVLNEYEDKEKAAKILDYLNSSNIKLMAHLKKKYKNTDMMESIEFLLKNYNPDVIFEHLPKGIDNTSYVVDKGTSIVYCLREKESGKNKIHDLHTLMFVNLHELSHIYNKGWGHKRDFWSSFKFILTEAQEIGIHSPINYSAEPMVYCGLPVKYNPYYDKSLAT